MFKSIPLNQVKPTVLEDESPALTHFMPLVFSILPENKKTKSFLMFSEGIERDQLHDMGQ